MTLEIIYEIGPTAEYPIGASIRLPDGTFAFSSGKNKEEAKRKVIKRAQFKLAPIPPPETVEL